MNTISSAEDFPLLTAQNHRITSAASTVYNCVAWAANDTTKWWQPGVYWPIATSRNDFGIDTLARAFETLGYERCEDTNLEAGFEKIVLYGNSIFYSHAARQLPSGKWTSKLGSDVDIEHDKPEDIAEGIYGVVIQFMRRRLVPH
jgi:hypothetical protein